MPRCSGITKKDKRCQRNSSSGSDYCRVHQQPCSICLNSLLNNIVKLKCGHEFHETCLDGWETQGNITCPMCREPFKEIQYMALITLVPNIPSHPTRTVEIPQNLVDVLLETLNIRRNDLSTREIEQISLHFDEITDMSEFLNDISVSFDLTEGSQQT